VLRLVILGLLAGCFRAPVEPPPASVAPLHAPKPRPKPPSTSIAGRVVLDGKPVVRFGVAVVGPHAEHAPDLVVFEHADGRFLLTDLPDGEKHLVIVGMTFARHRSSRVLVKDRTLDVGDIAVRPGFTIQGTVTDASSQPVRGANVRVLASPTRLFTSDRLAERTRGNFLTTTDRNGHFRIDGVTNPDLSSGFRIDAEKPTVGVALPQYVRTGSQTVSFTLSPPGTITGNVAGSVSVIAAYASGVFHHAYAQVAPNGDYVISVPAGTYEVYPGRFPSKQATVASGQTTTVNFP
jgi:hypothetical protein